MTATPGELAGLAQLTHELATIVGVPGVMVRVVDPDGPAAASIDHGVPTVELGAELVGTPAMEAVLAHEIAHLVLPHGESRVPRLLAGLSNGLFVAIVATAALMLVGLLDWRAVLMDWRAVLLVFASLALAVGADLLAAYLLRRCEYEADAHAVLLLDASGRDGRAAMRAALELEQARETPWEARVWWLLSDHPPAEARLRRLQPVEDES